MKIAPIFGTATVATSGTPVQIGAAYNGTLGTGNKNIPCRKITFIADAANSGRVSLGTKASHPVSLAAGGQVTIEFPEYGNELDLLDYWADASANGQIINFIAYRG